MHPGAYLGWMATQQIRISRRHDENDSPIALQTRKRAIPWRKVALVATPCFLSVVNLVEARFEKQRALTAGDNKFEQLRGVGKEAKRLAIEEGTAVGMKDYFGQIQAAGNRRRELSPAYDREADSIVTQGRAESSLIMNQSIVSKNIFGALRPIALIYLELARIKAETEHGIVLRINDGDPNPPEGKYPVPKIEFLGQIAPSPTRRRDLIQLRDQQLRRLPGLVAILREAPAAITRQVVQGGTCSFFDTPHVREIGVPR